MYFKSQIEQALYDYLSPAGKADLEAFVLSLNDDVECPNCESVIGGHESFCNDKCREEFFGESPETLCDSQTPDSLACEKYLPHQTGQGE